MRISDYDGWVVFSHGEYLVAVAYEDTRMCRWSLSPFDALLFNDVNDAINIAKASNGTILKFNPVTGKVSK